MTTRDARARKTRLRNHRDNTQVKAFVSGATAAAAGALAGAVVVLPAKPSPMRSPPRSL